MGLFKSIKKAVKSATKSVGKVANTVADVSTGGVYSKLTNSSSYLNDLSNKYFGTDFANVAIPTALGVAGAGYLGGLGTGVISSGGVTGTGASAVSNNIFSSLLGDFGSGIVKGVTGLGSDYLTSMINTSAQQKLNEQAYKQNVEMWNMQNAYNDPSAQMQRLQNAGLNPNLVYGSGNVTGTTTSNAPQIEAAKWDGVGSYRQRQLQEAGLALSMAQFQQQIQTQQIQNDLAKQRLQLNVAQNERMNKLTRAQIKNIENQIAHSGDLKFGGVNVSNAWDTFTNALKNGTGGASPELF